MPSIKKALSALCAAVLCSLVSSQGAAAESWNVSNFQASYIYDNDRTASIDFDLVAGQDMTQHHCSVAVPDTDITHLPSITEFGCQGSGGYLFNFTVEMLLPGLPIGADLAVYRSNIHGTRHFTDSDFTLYDAGNEQMDIKYTGPAEFVVDMYGN